MTTRIECRPARASRLLHTVRAVTLAVAVLAFSGFRIGGDLTLGAVASGDAPSGSVADMTRLAIEVPQLADPSLSPDGTLVLFTVARWLVAENHVVSELQLKRVASDDAPSVVSRSVSPRRPYAFEVSWCPDGTCFTYRSPESPGGGGIGPLLRYDLRSALASPIPVQDTELDRAVAADGQRQRVTAVGANYRWAPSGNTLAFTAPLRTVKPPKPLIGVRIEGVELVKNYSLDLPTTPTVQGLFELDVNTGHVRQLSPGTLSVSSFDWAPDGQSIAVAAVPTDASAEESVFTDLFIIDRATRVVRDLVRQAGTDGAPTWSPDGRWIAIRTSFGTPREGPYLGVVSTTGGKKIVRMAGDDPVSLLPMDHGEVYWMPDSRTFYFMTRSHMTRRLHRVDVAAARIVSLPVDETMAAGQFHFPKDRRSLLFVCSAPNIPPELCTRNLPDGPTKRVTSISPDFSLGSRVTSERISWPSRDGGTTLHGLLLTPRLSGATENASRAKPLPTLVSLKGGPTMVDASYDQAHAHILALVAHGYAVFIPNTRGRQGYGSEYNFSKGFPDPLAYAQVPYQDVMTGIEYLVNRGITDANRLGLFGHSYGGYLTWFMVTQTHQFRAAVSYEGVASDVVRAAMRYQPKTAGELMVKNLGVRNPFAPAERDKLIAITPVYNMHCMATPMLMLFGQNNGAKEHNAPQLFSGFQRFGIPAELIIYDEGHLVQRPTAKVDVGVRMAAWFDYWVRDLPYSEPTLGTQYDAWRSANQAKRSQPPSCATGTGTH